MILENRSSPSSSLGPLLSGFDRFCVSWHAKWSIETLEEEATVSTSAGLQETPTLISMSLDTGCSMTFSSVLVEGSFEDWITTINLKISAEGVEL